MVRPAVRILRQPGNPSSRFSLGCLSGIVNPTIRARDTSNLRKIIPDPSIAVELIGATDDVDALRPVITLDLLDQVVGHKVTPKKPSPRIDSSVQDPPSIAWIAVFSDVRSWSRTARSAAAPRSRSLTRT